jgi:hypothetical protein
MSPKRTIQLLMVSMKNSVRTKQEIIRAYFWLYHVYSSTKFRPNRRIFVFWWSFWIQNGCHSKPKWSQYGAACLTPCKYLFPLKSFHFWIFKDFFYFYIGGHFENFENKEHNFEWPSIFASSFKRICCSVWI